MTLKTLATGSTGKEVSMIQKLIQVVIDSVKQMRADSNSLEEFKYNSELAYNQISENLSTNEIITPSIKVMVLSILFSETQNIIESEIDKKGN